MESNNNISIIEEFISKEIKIIEDIFESNGGLNHILEIIKSEEESKEYEHYKELTYKLFGLYIIYRDLLKSTK